MNKEEIIGICEFLRVHHFENSYKLLDYYNKCNKQKEILDKIKEYCNNRLQYYNEMRRDYMREFDGYAENDIENILELLEEIE